MMLYNTQNSVTDTSGEFDIITLVMYRNGAERYVKKYNQNHLLIRWFISLFSELIISWFVSVLWLILSIAVESI